MADDGHILPTDVAARRLRVGEKDRTVFIYLTYDSMSLAAGNDSANLCSQLVLNKRPVWKKIEGEQVLYSAEALFLKTRSR